MGDSASRPPRILHVMDEFNLGGAGTHLATMLREAKRRYRLEHRVLSLFGDGPVGELIRTTGVPVEIQDYRTLLREHRYFAIFQALRERIAEFRPDVIEAHLTFSRLLALPAATLEGVPLRIGFEQGDVFFHSPKWRVANFLGQWFASRIIVCSHALHRWDSYTHGILPEKMSVFHNCVDPARFGTAASARIPRKELLPELTEEESGRMTLFCAVGTLGTGVNKRTDICVRAIAEARKCGANAGLVVCGYGPQRESLEKLAASLGVSRQVRFLGLRMDVNQVMASCDAFCHAAPFEPFGIVCVEAMLSGLPALVPDSGGIAEIVTDGVDGFHYPALNIEALAARMSELCANPAIGRSMGENGQAKALRSFHVRTYLDRLYSMYGFVKGPA